MSSPNRLRCSRCDSRFRSRSSLRRHERKHDAGASSHECHICDRTFYRKDHFRYHLVSAHNIGERLACQSCDKWFATRSSLKRHMDAMHPTEVMVWPPRILPGSESAAIPAQTESATHHMASSPAPTINAISSSDDSCHSFDAHELTPSHENTHPAALLDSVPESALSTATVANANRWLLNDDMDIDFAANDMTSDDICSILNRLPESALPPVAPATLSNDGQLEPSPLAAPSLTPHALVFSTTQETTNTTLLDVPNVIAFGSPASSHGSATPATDGMAQIEAPTAILQQNDEMIRSWLDQTCCDFPELVALAQQAPICPTENDDAIDHKLRNILIQSFTLLKNREALRAHQPPSTNPHLQTAC
ncbi:uncharacterized protein MONBRDRAFT_7806 [Monosiga brevicollis MX1]|uniref:C2H2-type domain-containing protein n=1 Tax=Monosiga brevicollis TaxID=81824 RepID=A9UXG8_MONBE|nr:uncharacterized protein MONBRDRAFT_7806 [Monosiga brevicollis MX1]EDQ90004.1 predicted protein [Monosiga brevicollis MX1]|eukprot:XP_001745426.1 hypothetical protein [Monosiga brevicollis MX1]